MLLKSSVPWEGVKLVNVNVRSAVQKLNIIFNFYGLHDLPSNIDGRLSSESELSSVDKYNISFIYASHVARKCSGVTLRIDKSN